jgi:hypothetical protein
MRDIDIKDDFRRNRSRPWPTGGGEREGERGGRRELRKRKLGYLAIDDGQCLLTSSITSSNNIESCNVKSEAAREIKGVGVSRNGGAYRALHQHVKRENLAGLDSRQTRRTSPDSSSCPQRRLTVQQR